MLLTGRGAETETAHSDSVVWDGESPKYVLIVTGEVSAYLCVIPLSHLYVHHSAPRRCS